MVCSGSPNSSCPDGLCRLGSIHAKQNTADSLDVRQLLPELLRLLDPAASSTRGWRLRPVGVNNASWLLECDAGYEGWMIKRSCVRRVGPNLPTGLENCDALVQKFPEILSDTRLAFPHSVVEIWSLNGKRRLSDLLISRRCPGVQLGRFLADLNLSKMEDQEQLERVAVGCGELLAEFHRRYLDPTTGDATYHTDFHPSNVLYDVKTGSLTIIDLEGMGCGGIGDDAEKFEMLLSKLAGERYGLAFKQSYLSLAPEEALAQTVAERSSSKSTAASSAELLYPTASTLEQPRTSAEQSFKCLSNLAISESGFDPQHTLVTLAWLVSPNEQLTQPRVQAIRRRKAWILHQLGRKDSFYLQLVPDDIYAAGGISIEKRCEDFIFEFPEALQDCHLAFPHSVIPLQMKLKSAGQVFVANCPCNTTLEQHVTQWRQEQQDEDELRALFRQVGVQMSQTLSKYTTPSWQLRPSCVLYDAQSGVITFADFAWPGDSNAMSAVDRLSKSMKLFADPSLVEVFCEGYNSTQRRRHNVWSHGCFGSFYGASPRRSESSEDEDDEDETELVREETNELTANECNTM